MCSPNDSSYCSLSFYSPSRGLLLAVIPNWARSITMISCFFLSRTLLFRGRWGYLYWKRIWTFVRGIRDYLKTDSRYLDRRREVYLCLQDLYRVIISTFHHLIFPLWLFHIYILQVFTRLSISFGQLVEMSIIIFIVITFHGRSEHDQASLCRANQLLESVKHKFEIDGIESQSKVVDLKTNQDEVTTRLCDSKFLAQEFRKTV